jgi:hypothetical protein
MRVAIKRLFEDIGQREERFRTIVTQVPGAVFRFRPDGADRLRVGRHRRFPAIRPRSSCAAPPMWTNLIAPEDRKPPAPRRDGGDPVAPAV